MHKYQDMGDGQFQVEVDLAHPQLRRYMLSSTDEKTIHFGPTDSGICKGGSSDSNTDHAGVFEGEGFGHRRYHEGSAQERIPMTKELHDMGALGTAWNSGREANRQRDDQKQETEIERERRTVNRRPTSRSDQ